MALVNPDPDAGFYVNLKDSQSEQTLKPKNFEKGREASSLQIILSNMNFLVWGPFLACPGCGSGSTDPINRRSFRIKTSILKF
jgi:hypothetical protein